MSRRRRLAVARGLLPVACGVLIGCLDTATPPPDGPIDPDTLRFDSPSGVALTPRYLLVTEIAARPRAGGLVDYDAGHLSIVERATGRRVARLLTTQPNPQYVTVDPTGTRALVVNAGTLDTARVPAVATSAGGIDVFDLSGPEPPAAPLRNVEIAPVPQAPSAAPGRLALSPSGRIALVGSGVAAHVYKVDLESGVLLRGPGDPLLPFGEPRGNGLTAPYREGSRLHVLDFNEDRLCVADDPSEDLSGDLAGARCGPVGIDPSQLEGPIDRLTGPGGRLYVLMSLSGALVEVDVGTDPFTSRVAAAIGPSAPNRLASCDGGRSAFVVASLFNNLVRVDPSSGATGPLAVFAPSSNPYDLAVDCEAQEAYVTQLVAGRVDRVDLASGAVEELR